MVSGVVEARICVSPIIHKYRGRTHRLSLREARLSGLEELLKYRDEIKMKMQAPKGQERIETLA